MLHEFRCLGCYEKVRGVDFDALNGTACPNCGRRHLKYYGPVKEVIEGVVAEGKGTPTQKNRRPV